MLIHIPNIGLPGVFMKTNEKHQENWVFAIIDWLKIEDAMKCAQRGMRFWENIMEIQQNYSNLKSKHPVFNSIEYTHCDDNEYFINFANDTQDSSVYLLSLIRTLPNQ